MTTNFRESVNFMEFTPDDRLVYAATNLHRDKVALVLMDPADCSEIEPLYEHPRYDISSITYSRRRKKLLAVYVTGHKEPIRHYFDDEERQLRERIQAHFPGRRYGVADSNKAETLYII